MIAFGDVDSIPLLPLSPMAVTIAEAFEEFQSHQVECSDTMKQELNVGKFMCIYFREKT